MNKYFTKEYIKECDCGEIQNIKKDYIEQGNWVYSDFHKEATFIKKIVGVGSDKKWYTANYELYFNDELKSKINRVRSELIWLPTGDQLEQILFEQELERELKITINISQYVTTIDIGVLHVYGTEIQDTQRHRDSKMAKLLALKSIIKNDFKYEPPDY
ncbi:MAG: hypothetical protein PVJ67_04110 [Candidatus Pacearchaeota archaeon]|jgi:hypothetical protein